MCGIAGTYGWADTSEALSKTRQMCQILAHRGPDAEGVWGNSSLTLGHRRLSIIDVSEAGNQPFFSEDGKLVIAFNGEIYNYLELKKELSAHFDFKTSTDTEVILAAYRHWGIDAVKRFVGMFAFALWDENESVFYLVRDPLGVKPIYWTSTARGVAFASELRALFPMLDGRPCLDPTSVNDYLHYQTVHAPNTIVKGVYMQMPGTIVSYKNGDRHQRIYWNLVENASHSSGQKSRDEVKADIRQLLRSSVELRMRADVPFGAFLSGGIDSSAIVGLMSEVATKKVNTFSITFHEKEFDESPYSQLIAKRFQTDHQEIRLSANDFLKHVPAALEAMDHPSGDGPNTWVVSKVTREKGVKMALSGIGGDELFAGYDVFKRLHSIEQKSWLNLPPSIFRKAGGNLLKRLKPGVASEKMAMSLASERMDFEHLYPITRQLYNEQQIEALMLVNGYENPMRPLLKSLAGAPLPLLSKISIAEISTYMQNVLLRDADQMSMAHALEIREPFLDHRLVSYALGVSDQIKYPHSPKELLVDSLNDLLPREIIDRPKMGFTFPWALWMKGELKDFCESNLQAFKNSECMRYDEVMHLWNRFLQSDPIITWSRIWPLVTLGHWIKRNGIEG